MKFRKRPIEVEAIQFTGEDGSLRRVIDFIERRLGSYRVGSYSYDSVQYELFIYTLEGEMRVSSGDWIICGIRGELYPCKPDVFVETYDPVPGERR